MNTGEVIDGRYTAIRKLGYGSMGEVWVVHDEQTGEDCALKYCLNEKEGDLGRFDREVRIMAAVDHENVIKVLEYNPSHTPPYFTMPLAAGNIWKLLPQYKGDVKQILGMFNAICSGVAALHAQGSYHRDIYPDNVLYFPDGRIIVSDLGLGRNIIRGSKIHDSSRSSGGSAFYTSPEQDDALENADARSEVFQLGKTLYALLTGNHPRLMDASKVSPGLYHIIDTAIKPDPRDRYQTVQELQAAVANYLPALEKPVDPVVQFSDSAKEVASSVRSGADAGACLPLLDVLYGVQDDPVLFLQYFEKLPVRVLETMVRDMPAEFLPIMRHYDGNLPVYIQEEKRKEFEYAEDIAKQMAVIFKRTSNLEVKRIALKNAMEQSVHFDRFSAMDMVEEMLEGIKDNEEALMIAHLLRENADQYVRMYHRYAKRHLHAHLQKVYDEMDALVAAGNS